jgi:hypothetical protein
MEKSGQSGGGGGGTTQKKRKKIDASFFSLEARE